MYAYPLTIAVCVRADAICLMIPLNPLLGRGWLACLAAVMASYPS